MSAGKSCRRLVVLEFILVLASSASICCDNDSRQTDAK